MQVSPSAMPIVQVSSPLLKPASPTHIPAIPVPPPLPKSLISKKSFIPPPSRSRLYGRGRAHSIASAHFDGILKLRTGEQALADNAAKHGIPLRYLRILNKTIQSVPIKILAAFRKMNPHAEYWHDGRRNNPVKGTEIPGKSDDWTPCAGLVPRDQSFTKLYGNEEKLKASQAAVNKLLEDKKQKHAVAIDAEIPAERIRQLRDEGLFTVEEEIGESKEITIRCRRTVDCDRKGTVEEERIFVGKLDERNAGETTYRIFVRYWDEKGQQRETPYQVLAEPAPSEGEEESAMSRAFAADLDMALISVHSAAHGPQDIARALDSWEFNWGGQPKEAEETLAPEDTGESSPHEIRGTENITSDEVPDHSPERRRSIPFLPEGDPGVISLRSYEWILPIFNQALAAELGRTRPLILHGAEINYHHSDPDNMLPIVVLLRRDFDLKPNDDKGLKKAGAIAKVLRRILRDPSVDLNEALAKLRKVYARIPDMDNPHANNPADDARSKPPFALPDRESNENANLDSAVFISYAEELQKIFRMAKNEGYLGFESNDAYKVLLRREQVLRPSYTESVRALDPDPRHTFDQIKKFSEDAAPPVSSICQGSEKARRQSIVRALQDFEEYTRCSSTASAITMTASERSHSLTDLSESPESWRAPSGNIPPLPPTKYPAILSPFSPLFSPTTENSEE